jgi:hypothetical protein
MPGVGKSTCACNAALDLELQSRFRHGVLWLRHRSSQGKLAMWLVRGGDTGCDAAEVERTGCFAHGGRRYVACDPAQMQALFARLFRGKSFLVVCELSAGTTLRSVREWAPGVSAERDAGAGGCAALVTCADARLLQALRCDRILQVREPLESR